MIVKNLGSDCPRCRRLAMNTQQAIKKLAIKVKFEYVKDMNAIMKYGAIRIPALVINEKVVSSGRALEIKEIENLLKE